jgi:hypothetical protein
MTMNDDSVREAVAVFKDAASLEAAIDDLLSHGFNRAELSLLASEKAVVEKLGHAFQSVRELEDDPHVPTVAYMARETVGDVEGATIGGLMYVGAMLGMVPVIASGGAIAAAIAAGAVLGGGGAAAGALLGRVFARNHAERIEEQLRDGGLLLWVRTWNGDREAKAVEILAAHAGEDVHVHALPAHHEPLSSRLDAMETPELGAARHTHLGYELLEAPDGHCYALGRLFASCVEAKSFIDALEREG